MHSALNQQSIDMTGCKTRPVSDVEIVLFDGFLLPGIAAIIEIFQRNNARTQWQCGDDPFYNVSLLSSSGGLVASSSSVHVWTQKMVLHRATSSTILLFIAGGVGARQAALDDRLSEWVRERYTISAVVCPISEGEIILQTIGLSGHDKVPSLDAGNPSDMPWQHHSRTATRAIRTALKVSADELTGSEMANAFASALARPPHPTPDTPPAPTPMWSPQRISEKIMASARWLEENADRPITIELAAEVSAMSERNFLRRFKAEIGMTPSDYLQRIRLELSCRMLVESQLPVDKIARRCGIGSGGQLAKLLKKHLSVTPTDYRSNKAAPDKVTARSGDFEDKGSMQACA